MDRKTAWLCWGLLLVCATWVAACAGAPASRAPSTTDLLLQAGFKARPPLQPDHLQKLPAQQFVTVPGSGGGTYYVYPDQGSNLLYFGNEDAYRRYKVKAAAAQAEEAQPVVGQQKWSAFDWTMYADEMGGGP